MQYNEIEINCVSMSDSGYYGAGESWHLPVNWKIIIEEGEIKDGNNIRIKIIGGQEMHETKPFLANVQTGLDGKKIAFVIMKSEGRMPAFVKLYSTIDSED